MSNVEVTREFRVCHYTPVQDTIAFEGEYVSVSYIIGGEHHVVYYRPSVSDGRVTLVPPVGVKTESGKCRGCYYIEIPELLIGRYHSTHIMVPTSMLHITSIS